MIEQLRQSLRALQKTGRDRGRSRRLPLGVRTDR